MGKRYAVTGCISSIGPVRKFNSGFEKQEIVLNDKDPKYPQEIAIGFAKEMIARLAEFSEGDHVHIQFDIRGREYNGRHFVDLNARSSERAVKIGGEPRVGGHRSPAQDPAPAPAAPSWQQNENDECPF